MRLNELVESKTILKEAAPAVIALPIIGAVAPETAALIAGALGLGALYTGDQLSKIKIDFPDAFENFNSVINNTRFKATAGNPIIAAMLLTQQLINNPEKFNDKAAVNDMAKSASAESLETNVSARPEVTANGGHTKRNQINRQRAWDAAYGQTHFHTGEVNPDAGKIDPALVKANIMAQPDYYDPRGKDQRATPTSAQSPEAMTLSPEIRSQVDQAADQMSDDIAAGKDPSVIAKDFVSTLKSNISPEDVPDISAAPTTGPKVSDAPTAPSFSAGDEVSYTSRRNPDGATATFVKNLPNGMVQLQRDGATFAVDPVNIDTTPPAAPTKAPDAQTSAPAMAPPSSSGTAPTAPPADTSVSRSKPATLDVPKDDAAPDVKQDMPAKTAPAVQTKAPDQLTAPDVKQDMPADAMPKGRQSDKPISRAAQPPALAEPVTGAPPTIGVVPPEAIPTSGDKAKPNVVPPIAIVPPRAGTNDVPKTVATPKTVTKPKADTKIDTKTKTPKGTSKKPGLKRRFRLPDRGPSRPQDPGRMMQFSPIEIKDPLSLKSTRSTYAPN